MKFIKKNISLIVTLCLILVVLVTFILTSCGTKNINIFKNNLSEVRYNYYLGEASGYTFSFTSGLREVDYKIDGYHTNNIEFGIVTIKLPDDVKYSGNANFRLDYGNKTTSGKLEQNPFDLTLMADIGFIIEDYEEIKITFKMDNINKVLTLKDVTKTFNYDYDNALEKFIMENYDDLKSYITKNELKAEIYVKIMYDNTLDSKFYYLIRVVGRNGNVLSGIIDPMSGDILAATNSNI